MSHCMDHSPLRLFCLPYAGGSARVFADWSADLPDWIDVRPLELPGRGLRFDEPPHASVGPLIEDLCALALPALDRRYAVFGHSLGGMLGYELIRALQQRGRPATRLFISGAGAPHFPCRRPAYHLGDQQFRAHLRELGGTPPEVIANDELMELLMPVLRADFTLADTYQPLPGPVVTCPVTAISGESDEDAPPADVAGWQRYAPAGFTFHMLDGGHFFLQTARTNLLRLIVSQLCPGCTAAPAGSTQRGIASP